MIISVCSDKGAPGVTTLATALAMVWPGDKVLVEADPSGGDLPFRLRHESAADGWLRQDPSIGSLAAVARLGAPPLGLAAFAQPSSLSVPVIPGLPTAERFAAVRSLWPQVAQLLEAWPGTVLADLGRLQPGHPAVAVARSSGVVLLLGRADLGGLFHLRERVMELAQSVGRPEQTGSPVMVVVTGPAKTRSKALSEVTALLASIGSPAPVAGFIPEDRQGAADLWAGVVTRRLAGSELMRAVRQLAEQVLRLRPDLLAAAVPTVVASAQPEPEAYGSPFPEPSAAPRALNGEAVRGG